MGFNSGFKGLSTSLVFVRSTLFNSELQIDSVFDPGWFSQISMDLLWV